MLWIRNTIVIAIVLLTSSSMLHAQNELRIRDLCRMRGQETNTLQGVGLVVGLKGSGDGDSVLVARALARTLSLMGAPIASDIQGQLQTAETKDAKNVALVVVTATVPASGAQPGDLLDCTISAVKAKSIEGGQLLLTPLLGPRSDQPVVYALANGPITIEDRNVPTTGKVSKGCKMETSIMTSYISNNKCTLVLSQEHSSFGTAQYIEDRINEEYQLGVIDSATSPGNIGNGNSKSSLGWLPARAIDQTHIEVEMPPVYRESPIKYISAMLDIPLINLRGNKRVVVREREGIIVIGEDVTISPVAIAHKNFSISTNSKSSSSGSFVDVTTVGQPDQQPTLQSLVNALNKLAVPADDVIAIIKTLKRQGNLYGELIIE
jgi:flagellar P-ring protein FlgI